MATAAELERRLGFFGPFMDAWGRAGPDQRAALLDSCRRFEAGQIPGVELEGDVSRILGIGVPRT